MDVTRTMQPINVLFGRPRCASTHAMRLVASVMVLHTHTKECGDTVSFELVVNVAEISSTGHHC